MKKDSIVVHQPINVSGNATQCVITIQFNTDLQVEPSVSPVESVTGGKLLLKINDAAEKLSLSRTHLYEFLTSGELESIKIGRSRLIPVDALEEFVSRYRQLKRHIQ